MAVMKYTRLIKRQSSVTFSLYVRFSMAFRCNNDRFSSNHLTIKFMSGAVGNMCQYMIKISEFSGYKISTISVSP